MDSLSFNQNLVSYLAEHRNPVATAVFQVFSYLGEIEGYLLVTALLYAAYDKRLAVQSAIVVLIAMIVNHVLKILIKNPRPFVLDQTYLDNWAVSSSNAGELAAEYSTPSGHAMAATAIYGFLFLRIRNSYVRAVLVSACILTGVSRPIIGVHFAEDILIGWCVGLALAFSAHRFADKIWTEWLRSSFAAQFGVVVGLCSLVWAATLLLDARPLTEQPTAFVSYLGLLAGVLLAAPAEARHVDYHVEGGLGRQTLARFALMLGLLVASLAFFDLLFGMIAPDGTLLGFGLRFLRYSLIGAVGVLLAAWLFVRLRLTASQRG